MPFVLLIASVLIAIALILGSGYSQSRKPGRSQQGRGQPQVRQVTTQPAQAPGPQPGATTQPGHVTTRRIQSMSREEIEKSLKRLEAAQAPEAQMGAMCYKMAAPPQRADYVCPTCGEKTLYVKDDAGFVAKELEACRREFDLARKAGHLAMSLDESSFCRHCQPKAKKHQLSLTITYPDGLAHTTSPVSRYDLRILCGFLKGELSYTTFNAGTYPLKKELPRLRELLGMPAKQDPSQSQPR